MNCPDCRDGYYYPLYGPREPCMTCATKCVAKRDVELALYDDTGQETNYPGYSRVQFDLSGIILGKSVQIAFPPCTSGMPSVVGRLVGLMGEDVVFYFDLRPKLCVLYGVIPVVTLKPDMVEI